MIVTIFILILIWCIELLLISARNIFMKCYEYNKKDSKAKFDGQFMNAEYARKELYEKEDNKGIILFSGVKVYYEFEYNGKKYEKFYIFKQGETIPETVTFCYLNEEDLKEPNLLMLCDPRDKEIYTKINDYRKYLKNELSLNMIINNLRQDMYLSLYLKNNRCNDLKIKSQVIYYYQRLHNNDEKITWSDNFEYSQARYKSLYYIMRSYKLT